MRVNFTKLLYEETGLHVIQLCFALQFTNAEMQRMEEMKHVALENVSHFLFIQEPRGQSKACIKGADIKDIHDSESW